MERQPAPGRDYGISAEESRRQAEHAFGLPPSRRPPRRWLRALILTVVPLGLLVAAVAGVIAVAGSIEDEQDPAATPTIPALPTVPEPVPPDDPPGREDPPPPPSSSESLFSPAGFGRTIATGRRLAGAGARVETLRLDDDRATFIARVGDRRKVILISRGFTRTVTTGAPATPSEREYSFRALDARAPSRLLAGIRRRYGLRPGAIDYLVSLRSPIGGELIWLAYPGGGRRHFQADAHGRSVTRVG